MNVGIEQSLKQLRILYAEDDPLMRQQMSKKLSRLCAHVYEAGDGAEALQIFTAHKPDIIVADIHMPTLGGLELIRAIRERGSSTPALIITAHVKEEYLFDAVRLSLEDYLVKPFTYEALTNALNKCVKRLIQTGSLRVFLGEGTTYHRLSGTLEKDGQTLDLTRKEQGLLELLLTQRHRVVTKEEIERAVWPEEGMSDGALKSVLVKLRRKIGKTAITNLPHLGYRIALPSDGAQS